MQQSVRDMCAKVQSLFLKPFLSWSLSSVDNLETIAYRNSSNHKNCNIKFFLNTFSNQITICQIWNFTFLSSIKSILEKWIFESVYFIFLLKRNKREIFNKRTLERDGCRETFLAEVTGNSVSDHYARNIYIKVDLNEIKNTLLKH